MAGQSLDELLIKIKVDLDAFKKSFADAKKVAQQGIKDIENTLNNSGNFRNAGKNAGNSFVQGFNESLKNLKSNTNSAVNDVNKSLGNIGKNNKDIKLKVNADTSGVTSGVSNAGNMISSGLSGIANYAGLEGVKNSVNSLQPAMKSIFKTDGIREYTKYVSNCIDYIDKLKNKEATAGSFENTKKIVDNILSNLERIKDGKWFGNNIDTSSLDMLISQLKEAKKEAENIKVNPIDKNRSTMPNAPNQTSKQTSPLSGWNGDVASFVDGINKALSEVDDSAKKSKAALQDYIDTFSKLPAAQQRVIEEASLMKAAMTLPQNVEGGIAFLRTLDSIDKKYKGTLSSIKAEDLGKILNDKFKFALDPSIFKGIGNNLTEALKTIDRDAGISPITGKIKDIADEAELDANRIEKAMKQAGMSIKAFNSDSSQQNQAFNQMGATRNIQQNISMIDRLKAKIKELDIPGLGQQTFGSLKNKINECLPNIDNLRNKLSNVFNKIPGMDNLKNKFNNLNLNNIINDIRKVFNQKDNTTGKSVEDIGKKAERSGSKIKGLIGKLASLFGIYKLGQILKEGTQDAIRYEASMMGIERRLGSASNIIKDFAENQATAFGLSKKNVAEYGNIYSVFVGDFSKSAEENAQLTVDLLKAAGTITTATGYNMDYVLQGLRSGIMGSTIAIDQFGLETLSPIY